MSNEDKIYNLLEKVYIEVQDTKNRVTNIEQKLTKVELIIENEIRPDIKGLYDTQSQVLAKLEEHDKRFDSIEAKLEKHDVEIRVIKAAK